MGVIVKPKNLKDRQVKRVDRIAESNPDRARTVASRISDRRNARGAENPQLVKKPVMKSGGMAKKAAFGDIIKKVGAGLASNLLGGMKNGGKAKGFPDLNKDGKVTKADILKGRGVIARGGTKLVPKKNSVSKNVSNLNKARGGTKMKKGC